jgi:hypothetical protein
MASQRNPKKLLNEAFRLLGVWYVDSGDFEREVFWWGFPAVLAIGLGGESAGCW